MSPSWVASFTNVIFVHFLGPSCSHFEWSMLIFLPCFRSPDHIVYLKQPPNSQKEEDHLGRRRGSKAPRNNSYDITPQCFDGKFFVKQDPFETSSKIARKLYFLNTWFKKYFISQSYADILVVIIWLQSQETFLPFTKLQFCKFIF